MRIKKNDIVEIISGKEKGKTGKLIKVEPRLYRVKVEKLFTVKRHVRPNQKNPQGGTVEKEAWLNISKDLPVCPQCNCGVKVKFQDVKGKKTRLCRQCGGGFGKS